MTIFNRFRITSLQHKITLYVLIPVCLLMMVMGVAGFLLSRDIILTQWGETAQANLQKAAHQIDMRLNRPKELLLLIHKDSDYTQNRIAYHFIIDQLKSIEGVIEVNVDWPEEPVRRSTDHRMGHGRAKNQVSRQMSEIQTSIPVFNPEFGSETVTISSGFFDNSGFQIGGVEAVIKFDDLIEQILNASKWQGNKVFIIDNRGNILSSSIQKKSSPLHQERKIFGDTDPLERKTLEAIQTRSDGTIFGPGHPPDEIIGFYRLMEAPWNIVIIAQGKKVLHSLIQFRTYYFLFGILFIFLIVFFIRATLNPARRAVQQVSHAAGEIAQGQFGPPLTVDSEDEVGILTDNFNKMSRQLQERLRLKKEMNLAKEIQQNLLPSSFYSNKAFEVSGASLYCDETGGDYFDIIEFPDAKTKVCIVVGDVVGHGVGAALLMTSTRAFMRSCLMNNISLENAITQVNQLIFQDTHKTGSFVTLFAIIIDSENKEMQWVRAGHDPAIIFDAGKKEVGELKGNGLVLGFDESFTYTENRVAALSKGSICLIGTDGLWDAENSKKQRFGKDRIYDSLSNRQFASSNEIIEFLMSDIEFFKGEAQQSDDITIVAIRFK